MMRCAAIQLAWRRGNHGDRHAQRRVDDSGEREPWGSTKHPAAAAQDICGRAAESRHCADKHPNDKHCDSAADEGASFASLGIFFVPTIHRGKTTTRVGACRRVHR